MPKGVKKPEPTPKVSTPKYTEEELKEIEKKLMAEKPVTKEDEMKAKSMAGVISDDEMKRIKAAQAPRGKFILVELGGGMYRVMNKRGQWVSPVTTLNIGSKLVTSFNIKDPEQRAANVSANKAQGIWTDLGKNEIV